MDFRIPAAKDPASLKRKAGEVDLHRDPSPSKKAAHAPGDSFDAFISSAENVNVSTDALGMKRMVVKLEKAILKNQRLRMKHVDEPLKFIESEIDIAEDVRSLMSISSNPELYPELLKLGGVKSITQLMLHENVDIQLGAIELINELLDEDLALVSQENEEDSLEGMRSLANAFIQEQLTDLLIQTLTRLNENNSDEKHAIFNILNIIENIVSIDPVKSEDIGQKSEILNWLLKRIQFKQFDSNQQYASELLAILLQGFPSNRQKCCQLSGIDNLLLVLSRYIRTDPKETDEVEFMENLFGCIVSLLSTSEAQKMFLEAEGIELMLFMLREKKMSKMGALRVLNSATLDFQNCIYLIEVSGKFSIYYLIYSGLKTIFPVFMQKHAKKYRKEYPDYSEAQEDENAVSIIASLLKATINSPEERSRIIVKFCENDFEKLDRLLNIRKKYSEKLLPVTLTLNRQLAMVNQNDISKAFREEMYLTRMEAGLLIVQLVDLIILHLCCDISVADLKESILEKLGHAHLSLKNVFQTITEYCDNIGESIDEENAERNLLHEMMEILQYKA